MSHRTKLIQLPQRTESDHQKTLSIPRRFTLDGFAEATSLGDGIDLRELDPLTELTVRTANSSFLITVLEPLDSRVLIRGGLLFFEPVEATLLGATFGGSLLKTAWIVHGMRMELYIGGCTVVTSPVRAVEIHEERRPALVSASLRSFRVSCPLERRRSGAVGRAGDKLRTGLVVLVNNEPRGQHEETLEE